MASSKQHTTSLFDGETALKPAQLTVFRNISPDGHLTDLRYKEDDQFVELLCRDALIFKRPTARAVHSRGTGGPKAPLRDEL
jgi:hypothetical protein